MSLTAGLLGKRAAQPWLVQMEFGDYASTRKLATPPTEFGHENLVTDWGVLGNQLAGCCAFSGSAHETMLWTAEAGAMAQFTDDSVLAEYGALTGYDPQTGADDNGTNVVELLSYRRKSGLADVSGKRHKIGAYVKLKPGNLTELRYASYYFDGVGIGVQFPEQWMDAFNAGRFVWDQVDDPNYVGGHYISDVAWRNNAPVIITWGQPVELTPAGYEQNADEVYAYLSLEKMINGVDLQGLNVAAMQDDIKQLTRVA